jgi:anaerobic magnesium-protoporphyrin IX monomethyl ester cyclase
MTNELLLISIATDSHRNIGCLSLFATASNAGISTNLLFIPREDEYSEEKFCSFLKTNGFRVIGISLTTRDFYFARKITSHVRKCLPEAHVVWGGIHPTCKPEECLDHADSICIGEGESFLIHLITTLRKGRDITTIPGIGVKTGNKKEMVINPPHIIEDLNSLPFPRFDFECYYVLDAAGLHSFGPQDYVKYARHKGDGYVLLTSRSCPHRCTYCINSFLNRLYGNNPSRLRRRLTVDNTLKEITHALSTIPGIGFINFMDDHFLTDSKWIEEFCKAYKKYVHLPFIIRATPDTISDKLVSLLKDAGLHTVQMGIQSGSKHTHRTIFHRSFSEENIVRAAKVLNHHHLECLYDFIIDNDFETDEDRDKTIELMLKLPKPYIANLFAMTVFPKTDLEATYEQRKMTPRIDPYASNYFNFNQNNFYYQLASLVPLVDEKEARLIFQNRTEPQVLSRLNELFLEKVPQMS